MVLRQFDLPLRHVFAISRGATDVSRTLIVELQQDGESGYGEAGENPFYGASVATMRGVLEAARPQIEAARPDDPAAFWEAMRPALATDTFAQCALDVAAHDLWGKLRKRPVWDLWGLRIDGPLPVTNYTIGIDTIDVMVQKMEEFAGWPVYKIKLGTADDLAIVRELRKHTSSVFRVDANCAWDAETAIRLSGPLKDLGVELIEQPLPPDCWDEMREVLRRSALPVIADESCRAEPDVERCGGHFHGINVKLVKCGGLAPARRMIGQARRLGLKAMVGCMTESSVGISAIGQLLPLLDYVDMDGALLLARDIASGVRIECGRVVYPQENGCGVRLV
jgi:L-alanine-DL-glutamate epimerase-like enolase superfamily enzyme